jgi:uncharacterized membrane protein YdjX (TVP38/TMEM64 family)
MFILPVVFVGCMLGSLAAMLLSRYLFRDMVKEKIKQNKWLSKNFEAIDSILIEKGAQSVALLRLTFFPFGLCSYILGVTSISPLKYMIGTSTYAVNAVMQVFIGSQLYHI